MIPPAPDELAWIAKLAERFGVEIDPYARAVAAEAHAPLAAARGARASRRRCPGAVKADAPSSGGPLRLVRYRPLFSGPAVERVPELQFQRPDAEIELSAHDAEIRGISPATRSSSARTARRSRCARASTGSSSHGAVRAPPRSTSASSSRPSR